MSKLRNCLLAALALATAAPVMAAENPFYEGKTINFIVGYAPGGGSDLSCRVFANHMGKHIAGHPNIIVKNMPGASGANAINYVGEAARKDGLTAICGTISILLPVLHDPSLRVDLSKFHFIAGVADSQVLYVRTDVKPNMKKPTDIFNAQGLVLGGFKVSSAKDIPARLAFDLLGLKYKYVTGINGDGAGRAAMQQGFVNAWMEGLASYVSITKPAMTETGQVIPIFQSGLPDDEGMLTEKDAALPEVPTFNEVYKTHFGKDPSGPLWDAMDVILGTYATSQRAIALPPGSPPASVDAMSAAVQGTLNDPAFLAEAHKVLGSGVKIFPAARVQKAFTKAMAAPTEAKDLIKKMISEGKKEVGR